MQSYFFLLVIFLWTSCGANQETYPQIIVDKKLNKYYDFAVVAMYKINSCCDCNCKGKSNLQDNKPDTMLLLELDLKLERLQEFSDTIVFYFSYFSIIENDTIRYQPFSNSLSSCLFNGVSFKLGSMQPYPTTFGDGEIFDINGLLLEDANKSFTRCQKSNINFSKTLKDALYRVGNY